MINFIEQFYRDLFLEIKDFSIDVIDGFLRFSGGGQYSREKAVF